MPSIGLQHPTHAKCSVKKKQTQTAEEYMCVCLNRPITQTANRPLDVL